MDIAVTPGRGALMERAGDGRYRMSAPWSEYSRGNPPPAWVVRIIQQVGEEEVARSRPKMLPVTRRDLIWMDGGLQSPEGAVKGFPLASKVVTACIVLVILALLAPGIAFRTRCCAS